MSANMKSRNERNDNLKKSDVVDEVVKIMMKKTM